jgi:hypothetical protein
VGFVIVERDIQEGKQPLEYPTFKGTFARREDAEEEAKHLTPEHGGEILVIPESASWLVQSWQKKPARRGLRRVTRH